MTWFKTGQEMATARVSSSFLWESCGNTQETKPRVEVIQLLSNPALANPARERDTRLYVSPLQKEQARGHPRLATGVRNTLD